MVLKLLIRLIGLMSFSLSFAQDVCVEEGRSIPVYPYAPKCCEGLSVRPPPKGIVGSAGTCYDPKDPKACVEAGKTVGVYPGAKQCCEGLMLKKAPKGVLGSAGTCYDPKACVGEGRSVVVHPKALKCCGGLELQPPEPGTFGSAGTCVSSRHPALPNVNDSRMQLKDPFKGSEKSLSPSKFSHGEAQ